MNSHYHALHIPNYEYVVNYSVFCFVFSIFQIFIYIYINQSENWHIV